MRSGRVSRTKPDQQMIGTSPSAADDLPETEIHDILRNDRRRNVIRVLQEHNTAVSLQELTDEVAIRETGETPPPEGTRDSVYVSLHQTHLPKLDDAGVIDYDTEDKTITLRPSMRRVSAYMDGRSPSPWLTYYRGLGLIGLVSVTLATVNVPPLASVAPGVVAGGFLLAMLLSAGYEYWRRSTLKR